MPVGNCKRELARTRAARVFTVVCGYTTAQREKMSSSFKRRLMKSCASAHGTHRAALAVAGLLCAIAPPSFAVDKPLTAPSDSLEEIVVTAQFRSEKLQNVPIAITALSSESMDSRNMTNLLDVANVAPNVTM